MFPNSIDQWLTGRAELEIRRWLYSIDQWQPAAEAGGAPPDGYTPPLGSLNHDEIDHLLRTEIVGRIGCHADGTTYVVPVTYVYAHGCIYGLLSAGMTLRLLRANPEVCFEVEHIDDMTNWQSVIAWGQFEELDGAEAEQALDLLVERLAQHMRAAARPLSAAQAPPLHGGPEGRKAVFYRIRLTRRSGRFESR